jgi:hypothetical protein
MSDLKCDRCGAPADIEIKTTITAISEKSQASFVGGSSSGTANMCMACIVEVGPEILSRMEVLEGPPQ